MINATGNIYSNGALVGGSSAGATNFNITNQFFNITNQTQSGLFYINGTNGNVGIGTTTQKATLQVGTGSFIMEPSAGNSNFGDNAYFSGGGWKYINTNGAGMLQIDNSGNIYFATAPSGTADNAITFSTRMYITQAGNVGINTTSPSSTMALTVNGNTTISGAGNCIIFNSGGKICST